MSWKVVKNVWVTYRLVLVAGALLGFRRALMHIGNDDVGVQNQLGLRGESEWRLSGNTPNIH